MATLSEVHPRWKDLDVYEPSPGGALSEKLLAQCRGYRSSRSRYYGSDGEREDLQALRIPNASFDLVITQDVMEHIARPDLAFAEIARVLRPGGTHVFTTPTTSEPTTVWRARAGNSGAIEHLLPPVFHRDPDNADGSLVIADWGRDLPELVDRWSPVETQVRSFDLRPQYGFAGAHLEVFVSIKFG